MLARPRSLCYQEFLEERRHHREHQIHFDPWLIKIGSWNVDGVATHSSR